MHACGGESATVHLLHHPTRTNVYNPYRSTVQLLHHSTRTNVYNSYRPPASALLGSTLDVLADDLAKVRALGQANGKVILGGLLATIASDSGSTPGRPASHTLNVVELRSNISQRDVDDAVVGKPRNGGKRRRLLTSVLGGSRGENGAKLAYEGAREPEGSGLVEEGRDLSGSTSVPGGEAEDVAVEALQVVGLDHWERGNGFLHEGGGRRSMQRTGHQPLARTRFHLTACLPAFVHTLLPCIFVITSSGRVSANWRAEKGWRRCVGQLDRRATSPLARPLHT